MKSLVPVILALTVSMSSALEDVNPDLAEITNFRQYSDTFASAGQPTREQFQAIADNGLEAAQYQVALKQVDALAKVGAGAGKQTILLPADAIDAFKNAFGMLKGGK